MTQVGGSYSGEVKIECLLFLSFFPSTTSMCQVKEEVQTVKVTDKNKTNAEAKTLP